MEEGLTIGTLLLVRISLALASLQQRGGGTGNQHDTKREANHEAKPS
jgi:hypothetical protein